MHRAESTGKKIKSEIDQSKWGRTEGASAKGLHSCTSSMCRKRQTVKYFSTCPTRTCETHYTVDDNRGQWYHSGEYAHIPLGGSVGPIKCRVERVDKRVERRESSIIDTYPTPLLEFAYSHPPATFCSLFRSDA